MFEQIINQIAMNGQICGRIDGNKVIIHETQLDEPHLTKVIALYQDSEYVTWIYNKESGGYNHGHYFHITQFTNALHDYINRS